MPASYPTRHPLLGLVMIIVNLPVRLKHATNEMPLNKNTFMCQSGPVKVQYTHLRSSGKASMLMLKDVFFFSFFFPVLLAVLQAAITAVVEYRHIKSANLS